MGENDPSRSYLGKPYLGTNHSFFSRSFDCTRFIEQAFKTGKCPLRYLDEFRIFKGFIRHGFVEHFHFHLANQVLGEPERHTQLRIKPFCHLIIFWLTPSPSYPIPKQYRSQHLPLD